MTARPGRALLQCALHTLDERLELNPGQHVVQQQDGLPDLAEAVRALGLVADGDGEVEGTVEATREAAGPAGGRRWSPALLVVPTRRVRLC